jgi:hypothetical protein
LVDLKDAKINNLTQQFSTRDYFNILRKKKEKMFFSCEKDFWFVEKTYPPLALKAKWLLHALIHASSF